MLENIVCHLTSVHRPFDTRIFVKEAKTLMQAGYKVVIVAPHNKDEVVNGIRIRAVPKPAGRRERIFQTSYEVYKAALDENAMLYYFHDPELIPVGLMLKMRGKKVVYDVHEDLPRQILTKHWINPLLRRGVAIGAQLMEIFGAYCFDRVVTATETIAKRFPSNKTSIIYNYPVIGELSTMDSISMPYDKRPLNVVYVGGITLIRGIREMVEAMSFMPTQSGIRLVLAGNFDPPELENEMRCISSWKYINYLGWQTREQIAKILANARVGLVLLHPTLNYLDSYPVKLFEYMSAGIPVVASDFQLWRKIIEDIKCGIVVDPLNPKAIADAILWLLENPIEAEKMGKRGQKAIYERFNWDTQAKKYVSITRELLMA